MSDVPLSVLNGYRDTLNAFVRRARRIEAHSLQKDQAQFIKWAHGAVELELTQEAGEMRVDVPPEEAFESLAARVRPLLLEQDGIHFRRVVAAIGAFGRGDTEVMRGRDVVQAIWERITGTDIVGFAVGEAVDGAPLIHDVDLAHGWLYGDLVHADRNVPERVFATTLNQRYIAAVLVYGQAALAAVATLNVVRMLTARGLLELDPDAETTPVLVTTPVTFPVSAARVTPTNQLAGFASASPGAGPAQSPGPSAAPSPSGDAGQDGSTP